MRSACFRPFAVSRRPRSGSPGSASQCRHRIRSIGQSLVVGLAHRARAARAAPSARCAPRRAAATLRHAPSASSSHASRVVGEIGARAPRRRRACAAPGRAPETRPRCGGTGCAPSSRPTTARRPASPPFSKYQTRWCSRKRPRIERTRMFSDMPGHARPQRARAAHDRGRSPRRPATPRRARGSRPPRPARSSWR